MRILFTGSSSFTGFWFARKLAREGHDVVATFTRDGLTEYSGLRRQRVEMLVAEKGIKPVWGASFGDDKFMHILAGCSSWDLLCQHGAETEDYRSPTFDALGALGANTCKLPQVLSEFSSKGGTRVILTGSYFEANEGCGSDPLCAFSPYGLSKTMTWQTFSYWCQTMQLQLGKFVLPNPVGRWDKRRFVGYLLHTWAEGETAIVCTPQYIRDFAPVHLLADEDAAFACYPDTYNKGVEKRNPSGWAESNESFANRSRRQIAAITGLKCAVQFRPQSNFNEPLVRRNTEPIFKTKTAEEDTAFWEDIWEYYRSL